MDLSHKPEKKRSFIPVILSLVVFLSLILTLILATGVADERKHLIINEFMASNRFVLQDEDGDYPDWIELYNPTDSPVNLKGYWLSDDPSAALHWFFPEKVMEPGEYLIVFASGKDRTDPEGGYLHTNFRINRGGDSVVLGRPDGDILDEITFEEKLPTNISYGRISPNEDEWAFFLDATPGRANDAQPYEEVLDMPRLEDEFPVYINEFLVRNRTSLVDEDGDMPEWIEFYNSGEEPVDLKGFWLSDKENNPYKWRFPGVVIQPGRHLVVFASGKDRRDPEGEYLHTNFGLNDRDDELVFKTPDGKVIDFIPVRDQHTDVSYGRDPDSPGNWLYFPRPTPGEPNYTVGFDSFDDFIPAEVGKLHINEVMAENLTTLADEDGDYPDWIELYNSSNQPIDLEGFGLSDKEDDLFRWQFPAVSIEPGEHLLVFASRKDRRSPEEGSLHTNYQIQATGETVVLTHPSGKIIDSLPTGRLSPDVSIGRYPDGNSTSRYHFPDPTPTGPNSPEKYAGYAGSPSVSHPGGFYDGPITVTLEAPSPGAEIHYTLNGREPAAEMSRYTKPISITDTARLRPPAYEEGEHYTGPIEITETTVLRARVYEEGRLPGTTINRTFFIGEEHTLPVVSLLTDPDDMFDRTHGIYMKGPGASSTFPHQGANYWQSIEVPIHMEFYEAEGRLGFSFDLGLRIAGVYSRAEDQKSFNIFARNIYGYNEFTYPFFPDFYPEKPLTNKALTLRTSGQDWKFSKIRDIFMTSLLADTGLDYQAHRQAVLYINGEYWGIYNIRERINEHFLAYNHGVNPDAVDILQGNGWVRSGSNQHYRDMVNFVRGNNMSRPENYQYIQTQMDVQNYIDYWVAQIYFAHADSANIRFWREQSEEGRWRWITFDLDWAFWINSYRHNTLAFVTNPAGTGYARSLNTDLMTGLLRNRDFRDKFLEHLVYHLNYTFATERVINRIDELAANIETEMPKHLERWGGSMSNWEYHVNVLRTFAENRQHYLLRYIRSYFNLTGEDMEKFYEWN